MTEQARESRRDPGLAQAPKGPFPLSDAPSPVEPAPSSERRWKVWFCKVGEVPAEAVPSGGDFPMREAITAAYKELTGAEPEFLFSGWGGELEEKERAVVENRLPDPALASEADSLRQQLEEVRADRAHIYDSAEALRQENERLREELGRLQAER